MWKKKEKYDDTDTRSWIVNKEDNEFRGVGWGVLYLVVFGIGALYDERFGYFMMGSFLTIMVISIYDSLKKRN